MDVILLPINERNRSRSSFNKAEGNDLIWLNERSNETKERISLQKNNNWIYNNNNQKIKIKKLKTKKKD